MNYLPYIFNLLLLLFWIRIWARPNSEFYFNPFLSGTIRLTDAIITFLRPVLALPEQAAALLLLLFSLTFKTLFTWRLGGTWIIKVGSLLSFTPSGDTTTFRHLLLFNLFNFSIFLLRLWTLYIIVQAITPRERRSRGIEALGFFCRPFSLLSPYLQPLALLFLHFCLVFTLTRIDFVTLTTTPLAPTTAASLLGSANIFATGSLPAQLLKTAWLAILSLSDGLLYLTRSLFIAIIGNLVTALLQLRNIMLLCSETVELLLGRFARRGGAGMGLDFTPLIFFFVADLLYRTLGNFLFQLINHPLLN